MRKNILVLLLSCCSVTPMLAQVEGETTSMELSSQPRSTYVDLLNELMQNLSPKAYGPGWEKDYQAWLSSAENRNTYKQSGYILGKMALHMKPENFKPGWESQSADWKKQLSSCRDKNQFALLLKRFESMLKPVAFMPSWEANRAGWAAAIEKKIIE